MSSILKYWPDRSPEGEREQCSLLVADQITQKGLGLPGPELYFNSQKMDISQQLPYNKQCELITGYYINDQNVGSWNSQVSRPHLHKKFSY